MTHDRTADLIQDMRRKVEAPREGTSWTYLTAPLTSTDWDGDAFSTTAKTPIDLSAVFSVPAGVKAVLALVALRDSGSAGGTYYLILSPNNTAGQGALTVGAERAANDGYRWASGVVPCDANGDIYYQVAASGVGTMDITLEIWGYCR